MTGAFENFAYLKKNAKFPLAADNVSYQVSHQSQGTSSLLRLAFTFEQIYQITQKHQFYITYLIFQLIKYWKYASSHNPW